LGGVAWNAIPPPGESIMPDSREPSKAQKDRASRLRARIEKVESSKTQPAPKPNPREFTDNAARDLAEKSLKNLIGDE
jgi:hypothetical protein